MEGKKLTVIIPNYNNEKYIEQCIYSVINQTYDSFKIVVVDDCSTDNSREILKRIENVEDLVEVICLDNNIGVSAARNIGINHANTMYVTCLDGDDFYYNPDKLKNEMNLLLKYHAKGEDILAYSMVVPTTENGEVISLPYYNKRKYINGCARMRLLSSVTETYWTRDYCVKKSIIECVGGYNYPKDYYEDYDLLNRLANRVGFFCTEDYGVAHRNTTNGLSKRTKVERRTTIREIKKRYKKSLSYVELISVQICEFGNWCLELRNKIKFKLSAK